MRKKSLYCPICGSQGEDMIFAFYCINTKCQNFRENINKEADRDEVDEREYDNNYWPLYGDD